MKQFLTVHVTSGLFDGEQPGLCLIETYNKKGDAEQLELFVFLQDNKWYTLKNEDVITISNRVSSIEEWRFLPERLVNESDRDKCITEAPDDDSFPNCN